MFKQIENFDYIMSIGTFFEDENLSNSLKNSLKDGTSFIYMHPIDNFKLKDNYTQFIKYEVASEEAILALVLNFFSNNIDDSLKKFLENLDIGYLSAESSAGEEEFEEAFSSFEDSKKRALIIGDDLINHLRVTNIVKLLANIKKYTEFELIFSNKELEEKVQKCSDLSLEEIEDLKSFNGTLIYFLNQGNSDFLVCSQTFLNIAKVKNEDRVKITLKDKVLEKTVKLDNNLLGTIAVANVDEKSSNYKFSQIKVEKKEQN